MNIFNLPDDIFSEKKELDSNIIIYHYTSQKNSLKEKSVLHRNAFSLVISGSKTMHFAEKTVYVHDSEIHILSAGNCIASVSISEQKPFESVLIFFDNQVLLDFYNKHPGLLNKFGKNPKAKSEAYISLIKTNS